LRRTHTFGDTHTHTLMDEKEPSKKERKKIPTKEEEEEEEKSLRGASFMRVS